ncbi:hypothetical protein RB595_002607 [Gaeumannomyces hyphopodioides]
MSAKPSLGAANQSRRRDANKDDQLDGGGVSAPSTFSYRGLELDKEAGSNLRLVSIEPSTTATNDEPMVCTLSVRLFEDRPQFEALSYMWGPETPSDERLEILLNGTRFPVRANLLGALRYLRTEKWASPSEAEPGTRLFWIDAICINQQDIEERNRQVPRMRHVYFRASTVVVWLGADYVEIQNRIPEFNKRPFPGPSDPRPKEEVEMVQALQTDKYWSRVWVLQEIGRARRLRVCFGSACIPWDDFIKLQTLHNCDSNGGGPLWLHLKLRVERQHTLKQLLDDHQKSNCSEPRDKVYGLVGLASDASRFPVDYKKSLVTVWEDTMVFLNAHGLIENSGEILQTGQVVRGLLMSRAPNPLAQVMPRTDMPEAREGTGHGGSFRLRAVYLGSVVHVGPSAADFVAKLSAADAWDTAVQDHFRDSERGEAHWESNLLQDSLLNLSREKLKRTCFNQTSSVIWEPDRLFQVANYSAEWSTEARAGSGTPVTEDSNTKLLSKGIKPLDQSDPRLILIKNKAWSDGWATKRKMGIASDSVLAGDSVYWAPLSRRALLVRVGYSKSSLVHARAVGTALTAEDLLSPCEKLDESDWNIDTSTIYVDAMTIFTILE